MDLGARGHVTAENKDVISATRRDDQELLSELLQGKRLYALDDLGKALQLSAQKGYSDCAALLLRAGALPDIHDPLGFTPIIMAAKEGHVEVIRMLIGAGCKINKPSRRIRATPLHYASANGHTRSVLLLLKHGANIDAQTINGNTSLMLAARAGHDETAEVLIEAGCDVNKRDAQKTTALHVAAEEGAIWCVKLLLQTSIEIDARRREGDTALMLAAQRGQLDVVRVLVEKGADVNLTGRCMTPLHWAADAGHSACVQALAEVMEDVDKPTTGSYHGGHFIVNKGMTPLMLAARGDHQGAIKALLARGANCALLDEEGLSALHYTIKKNHPNCLELLLRHTDILAPNSTDSDIVVSPLNMAVRMNHIKCVAVLLKANCDMYTIDHNSQDKMLFAFDIAMEKRYFTIVRMLLVAGYDVTVCNPALTQYSLGELVHEEPELFEDIQELMRTARSLKQLCRYFIRQSIGFRPQEIIFRLPLPTGIRDFLNLSELDNIVKEQFHDLPTDVATSSVGRRPDGCVLSSTSFAFVFSAP